MRSNTTDPGAASFTGVDPRDWSYWNSHPGLANPRLQVPWPPRRPTRRPATGWDAAAGPGGPGVRRRVSGEWDDPTFVAVQVDVEQMARLDATAMRDGYRGLHTRRYRRRKITGYVVTRKWGTDPHDRAYWDLATPDDGRWQLRRSNGVLLDHDTATMVAGWYEGAFLVPEYRHA